MNDIFFVKNVLVQPGLKTYKMVINGNTHHVKSAAQSLTFVI